MVLQSVARALESPNEGFIKRNIRALAEIRAEKKVDGSHKGNRHLGASLEDLEESYEETFATIFPLARTLKKMVEEKQIIGVVTEEEGARILLKALNPKRRKK